MDGLLLIDKPATWTSFDVVNRVRGIIAAVEQVKPKQIKVGHTGTLDPLATGLLIILIGSYTKRAGEFAKLDKTYELTMKLGVTSTTDDEEGEKTIVSDKHPSRETVEQILQSFTGVIQQTPPAFSAMKIKGQRAYKLARAGKTVTLEPRPITIFNSKLVDYTYPLVEATTLVSSGTYIRSLARDVGQQLGTGAYLVALRRSHIGPYSLTNAKGLNDLTYPAIEQALITP